MESDAKVRAADPLHQLPDLSSLSREKLEELTVTLHRLLLLQARIADPLPGGRDGGFSQAVVPRESLTREEIREQYGRGDEADLG